MAVSGAAGYPAMMVPGSQRSAHELGIEIWEIPLYRLSWTAPVKELKQAVGFARNAMGGRGVIAGALQIDAIVVHVPVGAV